MHRREFLFGTACACGCLAGCAELAVPEPGGDEDQRHPFADASLTVGVRSRSETDHDLRANARDALAYWEAHSQEFVGFGVDFELVDSEEPDIVIEYADDPGDCQDVPGYSEFVLGCAPLIRPGNRAPQPARAIVVAGDRPFGKIHITTKHELGHILGLGHQDEPLDIMSDRPADRIPLYDLRIEIWESVLDGQDFAASAADAFREGNRAWDGEDYGSAAARFDRARARFADARGQFEQIFEAVDTFEGHPRVETVDREALQSLGTALVERMEHGISFSESMAEASRAAADGAIQEANEHLERASADIDAFNESPTVEVREVAVALGLVRGFDREDPLVDEGESPS